MRSLMRQRPDILDYEGRKVVQWHDSMCASTPQQVRLSCFTVSSCSLVTRSRVPSACFAFFTLQMDPVLAPLINTTLPPPFWGEYGAKYQQRTDSVCLAFFQSVYWTIIWLFSNENWDGQSIIHWWSTIEPTICPGRRTRWKWVVCESNIAHSSTRKSICMGTRTDVSPTTMSNPDETISMGVLSGRGVDAQAGDVDAVVVRVIMIGDPCWWSTHVYWPPPVLRVVCKPFVWPFKTGLTWATILERRKWWWPWGTQPEMYWK